MCLNPRIIRNPYRAIEKHGERAFYEVPCGHCEECLKDRQNSFLIRSYYELLSHRGHFLTLTYSDPNLPVRIDRDSGEIVPTLSREHIHKFLDAIRHFCMRSDIPCPRYYICGEYGEKTFRPHYHCIWLDCPVSVLDFISIYWNKRHGFIRVDEVKSSTSDRFFSARYVAKYSAKSIFTTHDDMRFSTSMIAPFVVHSRDWGNDFMRYLTPILDSCIVSGSFNYDLFIRSLNVSFQHGQYKLPRYYRKRLLAFALSSEKYSHLFSPVAYKKALERFNHIRALQREYGVTEVEAEQMYNSDICYPVHQKTSEEIESDSIRLRNKRLISYAKDNF